MCAKRKWRRGLSIIDGVIRKRAAITLVQVSKTKERKERVYEQRGDRAGVRLVRARRGGGWWWLVVVGDEFHSLARFTMILRDGLPFFALYFRNALALLPRQFGYTYIL